MACRIIEQFKSLKIISIKITPHFHETTPGLKTVVEESAYAIYEETERGTNKDTSRMLQAGAARVYYAKVLDDRIKFVFKKITDLIPEDTPIICESPVLRNYIEPGVFIIMTSETTKKRKNISNLLKLPHLIFRFEDIQGISSIPVGFEDGKWVYK